MPGSGLSPFYVKFIDVQGFPIISSAKPADRALCEARRIVTEMFAQRPELVARLVERRIRLAIMAATELTTDIPEHSDLTPKDCWDQRARGLGATLARPAVSAAEENLLCDPSDRYRVMCRKSAGGKRKASQSLVVARRMLRSITGSATMAPRWAPRLYGSWSCGWQAG